MSSQRATAAAEFGMPGHRRCDGEPGGPNPHKSRHPLGPLRLLQFPAESSSPAKLQGFASKASCVIMTTEILRARLGPGTRRCKCDSS